MFLNSNLFSFSPTPPKSTAETCLEIPTMAEIMAVSKSQGLRIQLRTLGPFFKINAAGEKAGVEVGRAVGVIRRSFGGEKVLHLDSMRMSRATLDMDRSLFGLGLFLGAVAVRHGFDLGCKRAQLLAINDSPLYHSKLVRFYTRMGFEVVHEVDGSSIGDLAHMLVWGGRGTRMDADIQHLLLKWSKILKPPVDRSLYSEKPKPNI
ncbi:putative acyl-CoA N-acyltransferase [Dioscorea sansibarensis]